MLEKSVEGKSFILIIPNDFKIYEIFEFNIQKIGFDLTSIVPADFKYENNFLRVKNFFLKNFLEIELIKELIRKFRSGHIGQEIAHLGEKSIDYILVIRPDIFDNETIQKLLNIGKKVVGYQWDGLKRYPEGIQLYPFREIVFLRNDFKIIIFNSQIFSYAIIFSLILMTKWQLSENNIIYYVGSYIENRIDDLILYNG